MNCSGEEMRNRRERVAEDEWIEDGRDEPDAI
jgi:hypothetical protein